MFSCAKTAPISAENYFRIHVRANSNSEQDQSVKYAVRDITVELLTPLVGDANNLESAVSIVKKELPNVEKRAKECLKEKGFSYGAIAEIKREYFPTRVYGEYTLEAGEYLSLILTLGKGEGQNWWCVVYPPLCFSSAIAGEITYKSKLAELFSKWAGNG